jgi:SAM-dependent methyltransferase
LYVSMAVTSAPRSLDLEVVPPVHLFGTIDDQTWTWLNQEGPSLCPFLARYLPSLPDESIQAEFVGSAGREAITTGASIHDHFKRLYEDHAGALRSEAQVLDFGCGWGRVIRFFLKEVAPENLYGIDISERALAACRKTNKWCQFLKVTEFPPTTFEPESFDFIYAFSVFSHLSEEAHIRWLEEFRRIAKPGGIVLLTTFPRDFLERCAACEAGEHESDPEWQRRTALWFGAARDQLAAYDRGKFCYSPVSEDQLHFGTTCIPEEYVRRVWSRHLQVLDYVHDPWQNTIVSRKGTPR